MLSNAELLGLLEDEVVEGKPRFDVYRGMKAYRKQAIVGAKGLLYSKDVIQSIADAKTIGEVERILINARRSK